MTANRSWPTPPSRGLGLAASTHGEGTPVQLAPQAPTSNNELHFRAGTHSVFPASKSLQSTYDLVATTVLSGRPTDRDRHCPRHLVPVQAHRPHVRLDQQVARRKREADGRNRASPKLGIRVGRASRRPLPIPPCCTISHQSIKFTRLLEETPYGNVCTPRNPCRHRLGSRPCHRP